MYMYRNDEWQSEILMRSPIILSNQSVRELVLEQLLGSLGVDYLVKGVKRFMLSGDGERAMAQNRLEEVCPGISSPVSIAECENSNVEVLDEAVGPDTCLVIESGKIDVSLDENSTPPKKHSLSMEVRTFSYI